MFDFKGFFQIQHIPIFFLSHSTFHCSTMHRFLYNLCFLFRFFFFLGFYRIFIFFKHCVSSLFFILSLFWWFIRHIPWICICTLLRLEWSHTLYYNKLNCAYEIFTNVFGRHFFFFFHKLIYLHIYPNTMSHRAC